MELRWIDSNTVSTHDLADLPALREKTGGFLWLDIPEWSDEAEELLKRDFSFHPMAITESRNRNHIPRVHVYPQHVFIVVHAPEIGANGHVHYLELDQFVGENFLVTIHGPLSPKVPLQAALRETHAVAASNLTLRPDLRDCLLDCAPGSGDGCRYRTGSRPDGTARDVRGRRGPAAVPQRAVRGPS